MVPQNTIPVIALVGGVGSGKSSIARKLAEELPVAIIDADRIGHEVLTQPEIKEQVRKQFGATVFDPAGNVDRSALARRVFGTSAEQIAARKVLESIVHPEIGRGISREIDHHRQQGSIQVILLDAAVLFEAGWNQFADATVFIDTTDSVRQQRVRENRGWDAETLAAREQSQWPLDKKRAACHSNVDNSQSLTHAADQLRDVIATRFSHE